MRMAQHVVPDPCGGWRVIKSGAQRASRHFDRRDQAVDYARDLAKRQHSELVIHRKDGSITRSDSDGNDTPYTRDTDTH